MSKHTPGPWTLVDYNRFVTDKRGRLIVDTQSRIAFELPEGDEPRANAQLIAKAPAMYDLLRHAIDAFGPAIEDESDINGAGTIDWVCMFVQAAKNLLEPAKKGKQK